MKKLIFYLILGIITIVPMVVQSQSGNEHCLCTIELTQPCVKIRISYQVPLNSICCIDNRAPSVPTIMVMYECGTDRYLGPVYYVSPEYLTQCNIACIA